MVCTACWQPNHLHSVCGLPTLTSVCVCVCVCVRERESIYDIVCVILSVRVRLFGKYKSNSPLSLTPSVCVQRYKDLKPNNYYVV